jgi:hypothetical protein
LLAEPPRNERGEVQPHDHEGIGNSDGIIRRVSGQQVVDDPKAKGGKRLSTAAVSPSSGGNGGMSVDIQAEIEKAGLDAKQYVTTPRWTGSILFQAGQLRNEDFQVGYDPLPGNPYHGEVWGNFSRSRQKRLLDLSEWFVEIEGVALHP